MKREKGRRRGREKEKVAGEIEETIAPWLEKQRERPVETDCF